MGKKWLIALHGPTASGKTSLAIRLATHFNTHIISADSRQFFSELSIGVARPSDEELARATHHFIGFISIADNYSAGAFERDSMELLEDLFTRHDFVIVAGGSGLYLKALLYGFDNLPADPEVRSHLIQLHSEHGIEALQRELESSDPNYYKQVDTQNAHRLIRALEVCRITGQPYSMYTKGETKARSFEAIQVGLNSPREWLCARINQRVLNMMNEGLEDEVRSVLHHKDKNAFNTVGYKEWLDYFDGRISREKVQELIQQHTRQFAKRQLTWYKKQPDITWFDAQQEDQLLEEVLFHIQEKVNGSAQ